MGFNQTVFRKEYEMTVLEIFFFIYISVCMQIKYFYYGNMVLCLGGSQDFLGDAMFLSF